MNEITCPYCEKEDCYRDPWELEPVQITDYDDNKTYFDGGFIYTEELENFKVI